MEENKDNDIQINKRIKCKIKINFKKSIIILYFDEN